MSPTMSPTRAKMILDYLNEEDSFPAMTQAETTELLRDRNVYTFLIELAKTGHDRLTNREGE